MEIKEKKSYPKRNSAKIKTKKNLINEIKDNLSGLRTDLLELKQSI